jgi:hypothetical protein
LTWNFATRPLEVDNATDNCIVLVLMSVKSLVVVVSDSWILTTTGAAEVFTPADVVRMMVA